MSFQLTPEFAAAFADDWIAAWNSHVLERILGHYSEDVLFTSPFVPKILGTPNSSIHGRTNLAKYFASALALYPDLKFTPPSVFIGSQSVVLHYQSVGKRMAAEWMEFDDTGKVHRANAHYAGNSPAI